MDPFQDSRFGDFLRLQVWRFFGEIFGNGSTLETFWANIPMYLKGFFFDEFLDWYLKVNPLWTLFR